MVIRSRCRGRGRGRGRSRGRGRGASSMPHMPTVRSDPQAAGPSIPVVRSDLDAAGPLIPVVSSDPHAAGPSIPAVPSDSDDPTSSSHTVPSSVESCTTRRVRGRTTDRAIAGLGGADRAVVEWLPDGRPIGDQKKKLSTYIGLVARDPNNAPLQVTDWTQISQEKKEKMWDLVLDKFDITADHKGYIMQDLNKKWRDHRSDLKRNMYDPYETDEERRGKKPAFIGEEDWEYLLRLWSTPEYQAKSDRNKANRAKQVMGHCTGRTGYGQIQDRETKAKGAPPTRLKMFELTHSKDGKFVDIASKEAMTQMRAIVEEGSGSIGEDEVVSRVLGPERRGRVRLMGLGPTPSEVFGTKRTPPAATLLQENKKLKARVQTLETQFSAMTQFMGALSQRFGVDIPAQFPIPQSQPQPQPPTDEAASSSSDR